MDETSQPEFRATQSPDEVHESEPGLSVEIHKQALVVDGELLTIDDPPEVLQYVLTYNKDIIEKGIEDFLVHQKSLPWNKGAIIGRAPVIAMILGPAKASMSKLGQDNPNDLKTDINELKEKFHPFWHAIENAGFIPEARAFYSKYGTELRLYLRSPIIQEQTG